MKIKEVLLEKGLLGQFLGGLAGKSARQVDYEQKERKQEKEQDKRDKEAAKELGISVERYRRLRDEGKLEQFLKDREKTLKGVTRRPKGKK